MLKNFEEILKRAMQQKKLKLAVAVAQDREVLLAVEAARERGIVDVILVGDANKICQISEELTIDIRNFDLIDEPDLTLACRKAVEKVSSGEAQLLMKGLVDTSIVLKAVLDREIGLRTNRILSHVAVSQVTGYDRLIFMSDGGMNIDPDVIVKKDIIENAVSVARAIGIICPKVALVCAKEKVDSKMPCTIDAMELTEMNKKGDIKNCIVGGPFGLDNAISEEAALHKGVYHSVAGKADIIIVPNIETGNVFFKSLVYFARCKMAGVIMGAKAPIVLTSRADSDETKLNSIALATLIAGFSE